MIAPRGSKIGPAGARNRSKASVKILWNLSRHQNKQVRILLLVSMGQRRFKFSKNLQLYLEWQEQNPQCIAAPEIAAKKYNSKPMAEPEPCNKNRKKNLKQITIPIAMKLYKFATKLPKNIPNLSTYEKTNI